MRSFLACLCVVSITSAVRLRNGYVGELVSLELCAVNGVFEIVRTLLIRN
jgi:hypothetical protein